MTSFRTSCIAVLALALAVSCKSENGGVAGVLVVSRVDVEPGITDVILGQNLQLAATPRTASGITVPGRSIAWSTSDAQVATVSSNGMVHGVALGGPVRIRATVDGVVGDALISVRAVPVARVTVNPPNSGVLVGAGVQLTASAFDDAGNPLLGRSFLWESSAPAIAAVTTTGIVIGLAQGGPVTITAIAEGKSGSALVSVSTRPATRLAFAQQPGPAIAGAALSPAIQIALQDDLLTTVVGAANPVTLSLAGNPGGATLGGTTTINATSGLATFGNLTLDRPGTGYTFLVTSPGLAAATSTPFNVSVGTATKLVFATALPPSAQSGVPFGPQPVLQLQDAAGNAVPQAGVVITAALTSGAGTIGGGTSAITDGTGAAAFSTLSLSGPAGGYTVSFSAPGMTGISGPVTLGAGVARSLAMAVQPTSSAQSGVALSTQPSIQLKDAAGNNAPGSGVVITASIASGTGTLGGATTATTNAGGLAQFASLAINGASGNYTLGFSAPGGITGVTSSTIVLGAGAPTQLSMVTQPSAAAQSGVAFATQPSVRLRDGGGNPVTVAGVQVTVSIGSGGGSLSGTTITTTDATGTATFAGLAISGTVGPRTLGFASAGLTGTTSGTITLSAGPAAALGLSTQPSPSGASGVALAQQPVVQIRDLAGNPVTQNGTLVTATIASGPAGATLAGNVATTAGFGSATFSTLSITGPSGSYTIQFSAPGLTSVTSGSVTLGAGAPTTIAANSATTQSGTVSSAVAAPPSVKVTDGSGNPVAGVAVSFAVTAGGGTVVPAGPATVPTNASGIATATSWTLGPSAGTSNNTVTATAAVPNGSPVSFTASASAGGATTIAANSAVNQSATVGNAVAAPPSVKVTDAGNNPVAGILVTFAVTAGGGTVVPAGPTTVATNASGIATATSWTLGPGAGIGNNTVTATAPVPSGSPVTFTASGIAGAANTIAANSTTSQSAAVGTAVGTPPSAKVTDANGNAVAGVAVTFTLTAGGGTLSPASPAVINTDAAGVATLTSWTLGTSAGVNTVTASATVPNGSPVTFNATGTAAAAHAISANSLTSQSGTAGTAVAAPPSVKVSDINGNGVPGVAVAFAVSGGGGSIVPASPALVTSDGNGIATLTSWTLGTTAGPNSVTASASVSTGSPITFNATGLAGAANTIAANSVTSQSAIVSAPVAAPPSVKVTDANGNSKSGVAVTFTLTAGGGTLNPASPAVINTDVNGVATLTSWTVGSSPGTNNNTVTAAAAVPNGSPVTFTASGTTGTANTIAANSATSQSATVASAVAAPPSVLVTDAGGNPKSGVAVTFTLTAGGGTLSPASPAVINSDVNGVATLTSWTLGPGAGTSNNTVTATASVPNGSPLIFTASGVAGPANTIAANSTTSQSAAVGTAVGAPPSARVTDANGNPKAGVAVTFTLTAGGGTINPASPAVIDTDVNGVATLTSWTLGNSAGTNTVTAAATVPNGSPVSFNATGTAAAAHAIAANSSTTQSATVGTAVAAPPSVKVSDINGNGVPGVAVAFVITGGGGSSSPASPAAVSTDANGIASLSSWTLGTAAGTNTITASASVTTGSPVTFTATGIAGAANTIAANSATSQSGAVSAAAAAPPSVLVTDANGNTKLGVAVTFTLTAGGGTLNPASPASINTDVNGVATLTSWTLGAGVGTDNNTVSAVAAVPNGSPVTFNASGTSGAANSIAAGSATSQSATVGSAVTAPPSVLVTDVGGNPKSGVAVTFTLTGGGGTLSPGSPAVINTDVNGMATLTSWTLGTGAGSNNNTVSATASVPNGSPVLFTASGIAGAANTIAANSATSQSTPAGSPVGAPPSVTVTDANGNPKSGIAVTFTLTAGGGTLNPASPAVINTDANGVATLTSWTLGAGVGTDNNTVTATATVPNGSPVTFNASGTSGAANTIAAGSATSQSAQVGSPVGAAPSVLVTDAGGNPKSGVAVTFSVTAGGGTISPASPAVINTDVNGVATLTSWTLGTGAGASNNSVEATAAVPNGSPVTFTASGVAGPANSIAANSATSQSAPTGSPVGAPPSVTVTDANGNPKSGIAVTFTLTAGAGTLNPVSPAVINTDVNGVATLTSWTLGAGVGTDNNTVSAAAAVPNGSPVTFNASGTAPPATKLSITTEPGGAASGSPLSPQPVIQLRDANDNPVATNGVQIDVIIESGPVGGAISGTLSATTDPSGAATFGGIILTGPGSYTLRFTSSGLTHVISVIITVT